MYDDWKYNELKDVIIQNRMYGTCKYTERNEEEPSQEYFTLYTQNLVLQKFFVYDKGDILLTKDQILSRWYQISTYANKSNFLACLLLWIIHY